MLEERRERSVEEDHREGFGEARARAASEDARVITRLRIGPLLRVGLERRRDARISSLGAAHHPGMHREEESAFGEESAVREEFTRLELEVLEQLPWGANTRRVRQLAHRFGDDGRRLGAVHLTLGQVAILLAQLHLELLVDSNPPHLRRRAHHRRV